MKKLLEDQDQKYSQYRRLDKTIKRKKIQDAQQSPNKTYNPQGNCIFSENNFIDFKVQNGSQTINLWTYRQKANKEPKAIVVMFHGFNSYVGHGAHIAAEFSKNQIETVGFDYRGFGRSEGDAGYMESFQLHLQDCRKFVSLIKDIYPKKPLFALGLSLGGATSYHLSLQNEEMFNGTILMAPALKTDMPRCLFNIAKCLQILCFKKIKLLRPIFGKASKNPQITEDVQNDPYVYSGRVRLSTVSILTQLMQKSQQTFSQYRCPFIIFQGGLDKLVSPQVAFQLYDNSKTSKQDKEIIFYEEAWHDLWHEDIIIEIIQKSIKWIQSRV